MTRLNGAARLPAMVGMIVLAPGIAECFLGKSFRHAASTVLPLDRPLLLEKPKSTMPGR